MRGHSLSLLGTFGGDPPRLTWLGLRLAGENNLHARNAIGSQTPIEAGYRPLLPPGRRPASPALERLEAPSRSLSLPVAGTHIAPRVLRARGRPRDELSVHGRCRQQVVGRSQQARAAALGRGRLHVGDDRRSKVTSRTAVLGRTDSTNQVSTRSSISP